MQTRSTSSTSPGVSPHESQVAAGPLRGLRDAAANLLETAVHLLETGGRAARDSLRKAVAVLRGEGADAGERTFEVRRQAAVDAIVNEVREGLQYIREHALNNNDEYVLCRRLAAHVYILCFSSQGSDLNPHHIQGDGLLPRVAIALEGQCQGQFLGHLHSFQSSTAWTLRHELVDRTGGQHEGGVLRRWQDYPDPEGLTPFKDERGKDIHKRFC